MNYDDNWDGISVIIMVVFGILVYWVYGLAESGDHTTGKTPTCQVNECKPECGHSIQKDPVTDKQ